MENITGIKAISFDVDGTLWDFEQSMRQSLHHVLIELERLDPAMAAMLDVERIIAIRDQVGKQLKGKVIDLGQIRLEAFRETLKNIGKPDDALASHLNQLYMKHRFKDIHLFDDVLPVLGALKTKHTLGILSNGNTYPRHFGLEETFQFAVFSQDCGIEKPDPEIFRITVEQAGHSKNELLHVGDSLEDDVKGASNAGIKCVWLNRNRTKKSLNLEADWEISSLLELLELL